MKVFSFTFYIQKILVFFGPTLLFQLGFLPVFFFKIFSLFNCFNVNQLFFLLRHIEVPCPGFLETFRLSFNFICIIFHGFKEMQTVNYSFRKKRKVRKKQEKKLRNCHNSMRNSCRNYRYRSTNG